MDGAQDIQFHGDHIRIRHPPGYEISPETLREIWPMVGEACRRYGCYRVLVEAAAPVRRRMSDTDAYKSAVLAMEAMRGATLALCFPDYQVDETTALFKLAAANRGVRVEFFQERSAAMQWLGVGLDAVE